VYHYGGCGGWELHHKRSLIGHFYVQSVLVLGLKIQALGEKKELNLPFCKGTCMCPKGHSEGTEAPPSKNPCLPCPKKPPPSKHLVWLLTPSQRQLA
jgi:hypothetical protein